MATRRITTNTNISLDVLNALRNDASQNYREKVPFVTGNAESLRGIGTILMDNPALLNEFINTLVNRIAFTIITSKSYTNRLGFLKKGMIDMGETIEDIFVSMAEPYQYDGNAQANSIFARYNTDVKSAFYIMNAMSMYPVTINRQLTKSAFASIDSLNGFLENIIQSTYTAMEYDAQNIMMYLILRQVYDRKIKVESITAITDEETAKDALVAIRANGSKMTMLSSVSKQYNIAGVMNYLRPENAIVLIDADTRANIDVRALASAFNISYADFENRTLTIPKFTELDWDRLDVLFENDDSYINLETANIDIPIVFMDEAFLQCYDNLLEMRDAQNPVSLNWNYFLHHWATYAVSPFACACAFSNYVYTSVTATTNLKLFADNLGEVSSSSNAYTVASTNYKAGDTIQCTAVMSNTTGADALGVEYDVQSGTNLKHLGGGLFEVKTSTASNNTIRVTIHKTTDGTAITKDFYLTI